MKQMFFWTGASERFQNFHKQQQVTNKILYFFPNHIPGVFSQAEPRTKRPQPEDTGTLRGTSQNDAWLGAKSPTLTIAST